MASPSFEVLALGPMSSGINYQARVTSRTRFLFSKCQRSALVVRSTWLSTCNMAGILSMLGSCPTMSNKSPSGQIMVCHVYDGTYQRVMTIACCDCQSEDNDAQVLLWHNLNHVMARHGIPKPHFKKFIGNSAQANWNVVKIVYGSGDPKFPIDGRERTCYFHWTQSLEKHTKL